MARHWFVTGTGTDIGKTWVTAALAAQSVDRGRRVTALKPILSGFEPANAGTSDSAILLEACGREPTLENIDGITPWRFAAPLSPDMAAVREGRGLSLDEIVAFCRSAAEKAPDLCLLEGVGGAMVPLNAKHTVLDWIISLGWPSLLVAGSYLGTISHTLTTFEAMANRGVAPTAILLSESEQSPVPIEETRGTLARFLPKETRITCVPRIESGRGGWRALPSIAHLLGE